MTWVLYALQQIYFLVYVVFETALRGESLGVIIAAHLMLSAGVLKLCIDVVNIDASHVSSSEVDALERFAKEVYS